MTANQPRRVAVSKEVEFDAGHRVPLHASKCRNPHGHRYRVRATCSGLVVPDDQQSADAGMVVDFGDLKAWLTEHVHDRFDHGFIVWTGDRLMVDAFDDTVDALDAVGEAPFKVVTVDYVPTAENLARDIFATLDPIIDGGWLGALRLDMIEVWETPTSLATVTR